MTWEEPSLTKITKNKEHDEDDDEESQKSLWDQESTGNTYRIIEPLFWEPTVNDIDNALKWDWEV